MTMEGNVIDLTGDSDDERFQNSHSSHSQSKSVPIPPILKSPYQSTRDGIISPVSHPAPAQSQRQYDASQSPFSSQYQDKQQHVAPGSRLYPQQRNLMDSRMNSQHASPRPAWQQGIAQMSARPATQKKACVNCIAIGVTCDGVYPCSACVEPGIQCYYEGEKSHHSLGRPSMYSSPTRASSLYVSGHDHGHSPARQGAAQQSRSLTTFTNNSTQQSDLLPNHVLRVDNPTSTLRDSEIQTNEIAFYDSDESDDDDDDDDVASAIAEFEEVKNLLKKHETRMRDHRAYLLPPLLNQAKRDATHSLQPARSKTQKNPFINLISDTKTSVTNPNKSLVNQVQIKPHKSGAPRKWNTTSFTIKIIHVEPTFLPRYKSIGRLGTSLLAPNIRTLKYWPYFPDEEHVHPSEAKKHEELEERYQHDDNHLLAQRKCSELVDMWRPWVKDFVSKLGIEFSDIFYWFLHTRDKTTCATCERDIVVSSFAEVSRLLSAPPERSLSLARLSTIALSEVAKISMWHIASEAQSVVNLLRQLDPPKVGISTLCSICFLYNCLTHGAYHEPEEEGGMAIMGNNVEINDEEPHHNVKISTVIPNHDASENHQCGLYCVTGEVRIKDILGRRRDGTVSGTHNRNIHVPRPTFRNELLCSENCYWSVEKRTRFGNVSQTKDFQPKLPDKSKDLFRRLLSIYSNNQRAPCMLAKEIEHLKCVDAFYFMLSEIQRVDHFFEMAQAVRQNQRKVSKIAAGLDTTLSAELDERLPFVPCSHSGSCLNNPDCTCAQSKVHCEWFCGCDKSCDRRFAGCKCASANKTCFMDKSCECWKHNRECDPWLCGTCGVAEVLDPQNKYHEEVRRGRCKNNRIQLELPARTIKAPSEVQGWGLFAGTDFEENTFIGEYKGETVGNVESDRRGAVYANIGQEYLFLMNREQQIDGSNFGNKTRFINNSQRDDYINVFAKKLLCNGVQRVMLHSKKPIKAGEELLYNYNYPTSVTQKFWERGEAPTNQSGVVVAKPSITWTQPRVNGRFAKVAGGQDGEQASDTGNVSADNLNGEEQRLIRLDIKRKRVTEVDLPFGSAGGAGVLRIHGPRDTQKAPVALQFPDDPDDSDFEPVDASESSASVENADDDSDHVETSTTVRKGQQDRRRGGAAQVKAWETRRKRNGKAQ